MKKLIPTLIVILAIIGFIVGYLAVQNKVVVKVYKDTYKFDAEVTFSVKNLTLGIIKYQPCWKGIDIQRKINGEWTDLNIIEIEECQETENRGILPLIGRVFSFKVETGDFAKETILRERVERAAALITAGDYRVYFEYFDKNNKKTRAYSEVFRVE